jgi:hypothetical protein
MEIQVIGEESQKVNPIWIWERHFTVSDQVSIFALCCDPVGFEKYQCDTNGVTPRLLFDAPTFRQIYLTHSHGPYVPVNGDSSYSES